jgi:hypothetical protein
VAKIAARVMAGEPLARFALTEPRLQHVAVKEAVLPFARFPGCDVILGPEMKSTGEAMGIDQGFATAYLKAQLGAGVRLPRTGNVLLSVRDMDKFGVVDVARRLARLGFRLLATSGTAEFLRLAGVPVNTVAKCGERSPNVLDLVDQGKIQLLIDTSLWADEIPGGRLLRTRALQHRVLYCSRLSIARAMVGAIECQRDWNPSVRAAPVLQSAAPFAEAFHSSAANPVRGREQEDRGRRASDCRRDRQGRRAARIPHWQHTAVRQHVSGELRAEPGAGVQRGEFPPLSVGVNSGALMPFSTFERR